ncbi:PRD domain-containing protein [Bacillus sp. FJAT-50079]|uniref:BglG family transcription antiterminator n=1 Tax=Bacillus sp. FJAT-50079 TaxID=2833577 RepID=UPI001BC928A3|nr:PRD domain-containing protein [Bacillus sp. FJAT-50079]MBS4207880.1 transcription antiterminator [Bacillus sp. FJAT-50079]
MKIKRRQYQLTKMLCLTKEYKPMSYYAQNLSVSTRTIANDLKELNEVFQKYHVVLQKRPNYGVVLMGKETDLSRLIMDFDQNIDVNSIYERYARQAEILRIVVLCEEIVTYEKLAFILCTSTSIVSKDMANLRNFENDHCQIASGANGTGIKGTEYGKQKLLRDFFNSYMYDCYPNFSNEKLASTLSNYYPRTVIAVVKDTIDSFQAIFKRTLEDYYLNSLFIFLATIATRKQSGKEFVVDYEMSGRESIELLSNYYLAVEIGERFGEKLGIQFTKNEIDYISYQFFMHKIELSINNKYLENMLCDHVTDFTSRIGKSVGLDLSIDQNLYDALICHMIPMIYRIKSNIIIENPILNEVKSNYPVLFNLTWFYLNDFAKTFDITFSEDEISFITIHLQVAIERASSRGYVVIVCETGLLTSELLVSRIRKNLPASVELNVIPLNKISQENVESADFIISAISLENLGKPYIKVSPVVTDEELKEVYYHYLKYSKSEIVRFNHSKRNRMGFISGLINPEHIHIQAGLKTKEECIEYLVDSLYVANYVYEDFKTNIYDREALGSTYLASGVSFPHAMSDNVRESALSILLLPEGVLWDANLVYLVMMLAIKEENVEQIIEDLPILYKRVLDDQFVSEVVKLTGTDSVQRMFNS